MRRTSTAQSRSEAIFSFSTSSKPCILKKPVTSSRDTQEIFPTAGMEMLKIFKEYPQEASIFDQMSNEEKMMILQTQQQQQAQNQVQGGQGSNILLRQQIQQV